MISFKDKTFCSSPNCKNECGRKMTSEEAKTLQEMRVKYGCDIAVCYGYFCGEPNDRDK